LLLNRKVRALPAVRPGKLHDAVYSDHLGRGRRLERSHQNFRPQALGLILSSQTQAD